MLELTNEAPFGGNDRVLTGRVGHICTNIILEIAILSIDFVITSEIAYAVSAKIPNKCESR